MAANNKKRPVSLVGKLILTLAFMLGLAITTLMFALLLSDRAQEDPQLINQASSLRMLTYQVAYSAASANARTELEALTTEVDTAWQGDVFYTLRFRDNELAQQYRSSHNTWQTLRNDLLDGSLAATELASRTAALANDINQFVLIAENQALQRILSLRVILVVSLFATIILASLLLFWLKTRLEEPFYALTQQARQISQGDFTARTYFKREDELGILAKTLNKISYTISSIYGDLERRVDEQTLQLQRSHKTLQLLYGISRDINDKSLGYHDFDYIIQRLRRLIEIDDLELCLLTEQGQRPYLQFQPAQATCSSCVNMNCAECVSTSEPESFENDRYIYRYSLSRDQKQYGVLVARSSSAQKIDEWKQQLLRSVAEQLSLALNLKSEEENMRRLALMKERTVIARELHDSLAQALSYLKIQVVRLSKATQNNQADLVEEVTAELKEGLSSAYRQLRELLTTFRLKVDGSGLKNALQTTVQQLEERSDMQVKLHYGLNNVPLAPHEEVHLLQIVREASQNAIHHSQGKTLSIRFEQESNHIHLAIEDDGIGIPDKAEKLNHYGLAIMQERSRNLGGHLKVCLRPTAGTGVYFSFTPDYLNNAENSVPNQQKA